jgi:hypothetical protein
VPFARRVPSSLYDREICAGTTNLRQNRTPQFNTNFSGVCSVALRRAIASGLPNVILFEVKA